MTQHAQSSDRRELSHLLVASYGRSGSTAVQSLIGALPGYCIRGENYNVLGHLAAGARAAQITSLKFGSKPTLPDNPWYGAENIDPKAFARSICEAFVESVLQPPADCRVVGFKEIRLFQDVANAYDDLQFFCDYFSRPRIVFVQRSWEQVAASGWWVGALKDDVKRYVESCNEVMETFHATHPELSFIVQHSSFTLGNSHIEDLFSFLGERPEPELVESVLSKRLVHGHKAALAARSGRMSRQQMFGGTEAELAQRKWKLGPLSVSLRWSK